MGSFFGSVAVRATSAEEVIGQLEQRSRLRDTSHYVSPPLRGWIVVYPASHQDGPLTAEVLSRRLSTHALWFYVHDSDTFACTLFHKGDQLDSFEWSSGPTGCVAWITGVGMPNADLYSPVLAEGRTPADLRAVFRRPRLFADSLLVAFADRLGIASVGSSYDYFHRGQRQGIQRAADYVHVECEEDCHQRNRRERQAEVDRERDEEIKRRGMLASMATMPIGRDPQLCVLTIAGVQSDGTLLFAHSNDVAAPTLYSLALGESPRFMMTPPIAPMMLSGLWVPPNRRQVWTIHSLLKCPAVIDLNDLKIEALSSASGALRLLFPRFVGAGPDGIVGFDRGRGEIQFVPLRGRSCREPISAEEPVVFDVSQSGELVARTEQGRVRFFRWSDRATEVGDPYVMNGDQTKLLRVAISPDETAVALAERGRLTLRSVAHRRDEETLKWQDSEEGIRRGLDLLQVGTPTLGLSRADIDALREATDRMLSENLRGVAASLAWSPDGARLAVGCGDGFVRVWELAAKAWVREVPDHGGPIRALRFDPTSRFLATSNGRAAVKVWDLNA